MSQPRSLPMGPEAVAPATATATPATTATTPTAEKPSAAAHSKRQRSTSSSHCDSSAKDLQECDTPPKKKYKFHALLHDTLSRHPAREDEDKQEWLALARDVCRAARINKRQDQYYLEADVFKQQAHAILLLAPRAFRLLQISKAEVEWRDRSSLRAIVIPPRRDQPVRCLPGKVTSATAARALVKFVLAKSGHSLPSASRLGGRSVYLLDPAFGSGARTDNGSIAGGGVDNGNGAGDDTSSGTDNDNDHQGGNDRQGSNTDQGSSATDSDDSPRTATSSAEPLLRVEQPSPGMRSLTSSSGHLGPFLLNQYHREDNLTAMRRLPDASIDTIVTSPPFNKAGLRRTVTGKRHSIAPPKTPGSWFHAIPYDVYVDDMDEDEYKAGQVAFLQECRRVLKPGGIIFYHHCHRIVGHSTYSVESLFHRAGVNWFRTIVWNQETSVQQNDDGPTPVVEFIYLLTRDNQIAPHYHKQAVPLPFRPNLWSINKARSEVHPCVFPALLVENCILLNSKEGDIILDPHAGSGSVLLAAHNLKRRFLGFDISPQYQAAFAAQMKPCDQ